MTTSVSRAGFAQIRQTAASRAFRAAVDEARRDLLAANHWLTRERDEAKAAVQPAIAELAAARAEIAAHATTITELRAEIAEDIARAIEVNHGQRCDKCGGEPASLKWGRSAGVLEGRCGCGHTWTATTRKGYWRKAEDIARETGRG